MKLKTQSIDSIHGLQHFIILRKNCYLFVISRHAAVKRLYKMLVDRVRDTDDWRHLNLAMLVTMGGIRNSEDELYYIKETCDILASIQGKKRRQSDPAKGFWVSCNLVHQSTVSNGFINGRTFPWSNSLLFRSIVRLLKVKCFRNQNFSSLLFKA